MLATERRGPPRERGLDVCWLVLLVGLGVVAAALLAYPVSHLGSPVSFNYSEGWNSYWDAVAGSGRALYAAVPDLTIVNYPPLSFHLIGWFGRVLGDVTLAGRIVALLCLGWSALNIATAVHTLTASWRGGAFAALCFLLWVALLTPSRIATNDPHFLALAFSTLGLCAVLRAQARVGWLVVAAVCFAVSVFTKNNLLAFPIATAAYLVLNRRFRALAVFVGAGASVALLFLALTFAIDGPNFIANVLGKRAFNRGAGLENIGTFCDFFYAPVLIAMAWLLWRKPPAITYVALCLVYAAVLAGAFGFGNGVTYNIHYEALAALAIVVAAAMMDVERSLAGTPRRAVLVVALALAAVAPVLTRAPAGVYGALGRTGRLPQLEADQAKAVAAVRASPGPALCESLLICFEAGKPFVYDAYYVKDQISIGRVAEARIVAQLEAHYYGAVEIGENEVTITLEPSERLRFTAGVMSALLAHYQIVERSPAYVVLTPK